MPPEINVSWTAAAPSRAASSACRRQDIYDYAHTTACGAWLQWKLRPETEVPAWQASDWVELWIRGGEIAVNGEKAHSRTASS